jgi:hypothetical protein
MTGDSDRGDDDWVYRSRELFLTDLWSLVVDEDARVGHVPAAVREDRGGPGPRRTTPRGDPDLA